MQETVTMPCTKFSYCENSVVPEIPYVGDVLYALGVANEYACCYPFCQGNHRLYIDNVNLVIATIGSGAEILKSNHGQNSDRVIALIILDLCPEPARCLFNNAFVEAMRCAGKSVPPKGTGRAELISRCRCESCGKRRKAEGITAR